jgi:hypothetical protein
MFVDEIAHPVITDGRWQTADNAARSSNCIDELALEVDDR